MVAAGTVSTLSWMIMGILVMMIQIWWRNCCVIHYFTLYRAVKTDMAWVQQYELHMNDIVQCSWHVSWLFFQSRPFYSFYERARNRSSFLYILHESHPRIIEGYILTSKLIFILPCALQWPLQTIPNTLQIQNYNVHLHLSVLQWSMYLLELCEIYMLNWWALDKDIEETNHL